MWTWVDAGSSDGWRMGDGLQKPNFAKTDSKQSPMISNWVRSSMILPFDHMVTEESCRSLQNRSKCWMRPLQCWAPHPGAVQAFGEGRSSVWTRVGGDDSSKSYVFSTGSEEWFSNVDGRFQGFQIFFWFFLKIVHLRSDIPLGSCLGVSLDLRQSEGSCRSSREARALRCRGQGPHNSQALRARTPSVLLKHWR